MSDSQKRTAAIVFNYLSETCPKAAKRLCKATATTAEEFAAVEGSAEKLGTIVASKKRAAALVFNYLSETCPKAAKRLCKASGTSAKEFAAVEGGSEKLDAIVAAHTASRDSLTSSDSSDSDSDSSSSSSDEGAAAAPKAAPTADAKADSKAAAKAAAKAAREALANPVICAQCGEPQSETRPFSKTQARKFEARGTCNGLCTPCVQEKLGHAKAAAAYARDSTKQSFSTTIPKRKKSFSASMRGTGGDGAARVQPGRAAKTWDHSTATEANRDALHPARDGDWKCAACRRNNFASRTACFKCDAPKPEGLGAGGAEGDGGGDTPALKPEEQRSVPGSTGNTYASTSIKEFGGTKKTF